MRRPWGCPWHVVKGGTPGGPLASLRATVNNGTTRYDTFVNRLRTELKELNATSSHVRLVTGRLATAMQARLLMERGDPTVCEAFLATVGFPGVFVTGDGTETMIVL